MIIGASHVARGVTKFGEWSKVMVKEFGERIKPQLFKLWSESKKFHAQSRRDLNPDGPTPEQTRLSRLKDSLAERALQLDARVAGGDLAKTPRTQTALDAEGLKLKADYQRAKDAFDMAVEKDRLRNRTPLQKTADGFVKVQRAMKLTGTGTLAKLSGAAVARVGVTPVEEAIGAVYSKLPILSRVAARAPREGGINLGAEAAALGKQGFIKGVQQIPGVLSTGRSELDVVHGKRVTSPHNLLDAPGAVHGAIKNLVKYAEFARSARKRAAFYEREGLDTSNPLVKARIETEAYQDAQRAIFMQENPLNSAFRGFVRQLQGSKTHPNLGFYTAKGLEFLLPIVKVPTNVIGEGVTYTTGALSAPVRLANAMRKGLETLEPQQADLIMREFKKGSLGAGLLALGFLGYQQIGGQHQQGQKHEKGDLKPGDIQMFGVTIPKKWLHAPAFEVLNVGSTIRRVAEKYNRRTGETEGIAAGTLAGLLGIIKEVPFLKTGAAMEKLLSGGAQGDYTAGEFAKSTLVPIGVQDLAKALDKKDAHGEPVKRSPRTLAEHIEMGIPGLRQNVPYASRTKEDQLAAKALMNSDEKRAFDSDILARKINEQKMRTLQKKLKEDREKRMRELSLR